MPGSQTGVGAAMVRTAGDPLVTVAGAFPLDATGGRSGETRADENPSIAGGRSPGCSGVVPGRVAGGPVGAGPPGGVPSAHEVSRSPSTAADAGWRSSSWLDAEAVVPGGQSPAPAMMRRRRRAAPSPGARTSGASATAADAWITLAGRT
jgi:hypothetical protein